MKIIKVDRWKEAALDTGAIKIEARTVEEAQKRLAQVWPAFVPETLRYCQDGKGTLNCYFEGKVKEC